MTGASQVEYQAVSLIDSSKLQPLLKQLGYDRSVTLIESNIREIRDRGGEVFIARCGSEIVGCIAAIIDVRLAAGKQGEIVTLVVMDRFRQKGIGAQLLRCAEQWLSPQVSSIRVRANATREKAHQFYIHMGYTESKTQKIFSRKLTS